MYISLDTEKNSDLLQDRTVLSTGRTLHGIQNGVLTTAKSWGLDAKTVSD